ncbi:MAG TPA: translation initiation factor 2 [Anaeromyxobacteraceae bacterium]
MKTLTELSGTLVRMAARAIQEARRSLPREEPTPAEAAPAEAAPTEAAPTEAPAAEAPAADGATATEAAPAEATVEGAPAEASAEGGAAAKRPPARGKPREEEETEAVKAALDAAVATATSLSGDRLARLRDAVKAAGPRVDDVRLVRVFGPEEPVAGAKTIGGFQYLVDHSPASMTQTHAAKKERGGRGGGGPGGGGGRPGGGGKGAPTSGGFSMDSLRDDRKGSRGSGKPGGGGRPGGGRPK